MKDWLELEPDRYKLMNKHYTPGRGGAEIECVVIHHNAGVLTIDQIWDVWQTREASAHYQVQSDGQIGQLVNDWDTAWHAANQYTNQRAIGIEVSNCGGPDQDWPITDTAVREAGRLIAAVCLQYGLGRPVSGDNVRYHREFTGTSCPYHLAPGGKYNTALIEEAQRFYDELKAQKDGAQPTGRHALQEPAPEPTGGSTLLGGVSAAALNDTKLAAQEVRDLLKATRPSAVNKAKGYTLADYIILIDRAVWEQRQLAYAIAHKVGLDPERIIADAIARDKEGK